jgi:hypothetical protein
MVGGFGKKECFSPESFIISAAGPASTAVRTTAARFRESVHERSSDAGRDLRGACRHRRDRGDRGRVRPQPPPQVRVKFPDGQRAVTVWGCEAEPQAAEAAEAKVDSGRWCREFAECSGRGQQ